jgi:hypothetical protein
MHRLEQLITSVTEQLRLLASARLHAAGTVDLTAGTNGCSAPTESSEDRRER